MLAGEFGGAADHFHRASASYATIGDQAGEHHASAMRGLAFLEMGEADRAESIFSEIGPRAELANDSHAFLEALLGLTQVALMKREFGRARRITDAAIEQADNRGLIWAIWPLACLRLESLLGDEGIVVFNEAFRALQIPETGSLPELTDAHLQGLESVARVIEGDLGVGTTDGSESVHRLANAGRPSVAIRILGYLCERFQEAGEIELAIRFSEQGANVSLAVGNVSAALFELRRMSRFFVQSDRPAEAIEAIERAINESQRAGWTEEIEALLHSALAIERALGYPRLVVHRLTRIADICGALYGISRKLVCLVEALHVGVPAHVHGMDVIAETVVAHLSEEMVTSMDDRELLAFARVLGGAKQFETAQGLVASRARRYVSEEKSRRAAELAAELAEIALSLGRLDVTESSYAMAIVLGERLGILETESWRDRLDAVLYG